MVKRFLFETALGDRLLSAFERVTGCALVPLEQLQETRAEPAPDGGQLAAEVAWDERTGSWCAVLGPAAEQAE